MQPFQQRVVTERDELSEKLTSLDSFIGGEIFKVIPAEREDSSCKTGWSDERISRHSQRPYQRFSSPKFDNRSIGDLHV